MTGTENVPAPSKKRAAIKEISRQNPDLDEEDVFEQEMGTFKKASDEVIATRRIVKVRRQHTSSAPSSNPFASICLVSNTESDADGKKPVSEDSKVVKDDTKKQSEIMSDELTDESAIAEGLKNRTNKEPEIKLDESKAEYELAEGEKDGTNEQLETKLDESKTNCVIDVGKVTDKENSEATDVTASSGVGDKAKKNEEGDGQGNRDLSSENFKVNSFQQLSSSQNAFTGLTGSGFHGSAFSFGLAFPKDGVATGVDSDSTTASKTEQPLSYPSFGFGRSNNVNSGLFGSVDASKSGGDFSSRKEVPTENGEENEEAVFQADCVLFEFVDGGWKERGKGEIRVNVLINETERARIVMRARGIYRLLLNASLYPDMKLTNMDKKGITFACINIAGEGKDTGLSTFALKFKDGSIVEQFRAAVTAYKGTATTVIKTIGNSPKASEGSD